MALHLQYTYLLSMDYHSLQALRGLSLVNLERMFHCTSLCFWLRIL